MGVQTPTHKVFRRLGYRWYLEPNMTSVSFSRSTLPKQGLLSKQNNGHGWVLGIYIYMAIHVSLDFRIIFFWNLDEFRSFGAWRK